MWGGIRGLGIAAILVWSGTPLGLGAQSESPWQVVADFNPAQPLYIQLINQTPYPLEYALSDPRPQVTELQAGEQIQLSPVRLPNCLAINTPMLAPVQYQVSSLPGNGLQVTVQVSSDIYGVHCLDLRRDGRVFVY